MVMNIPWGAARSLCYHHWYCLSWQYCSCWPAFPLFLSSLTSLIVNLCLLFGAQRRIRRQKPFYYYYYYFLNKQERRDLQGLLYPGGALRSCLVSVPPFSSMVFNPKGKWSLRVFSLSPGFPNLEQHWAHRSISFIIRLSNLGLSHCATQ